MLGECGVTVFGVEELAKRYKKNFPYSLRDAPMLLPTHSSSLRRALEQWFDEQDIHPAVAHEFEDSAILKVFGQAGEGLLAVPTAVEDEVGRQYEVQRVGRIPAVKERFSAISVERRLKHPVVVAISKAARNELFCD